MQKSLQKMIVIAVNQDLVVAKAYLLFSCKKYSLEHKNSARSGLLRTRHCLLRK